MTPTPKQVITVLAIVLIALMCVIGFTSCSPKSYSGILYDCKGDTVSCDGARFKILTTIPKCGNKAVFIPTRNKQKVNSIKLKN